MGYVTKHTVKYNGKSYAPGSEIDVKDAKELKRLIEMGAIIKGELKKAAAEDAAAKPEPKGKTKK